MSLKNTDVRCPCSGKYNCVHKALVKDCVDDEVVPER